MGFPVPLKYALLDDGGRFLFDPSAEAQPTHVDGKRVIGVAAGPVVDVDVEDDASPANWKKIRAAVGQVLAAERPDVPPAPDPAPAHTWGGG